MMEVSGFDEMLRSLGHLERRLTDKATADVARAMAEVVADRARQLCPVGDLEHNPGAKPLRDTIGVDVRQYAGRALALAGPEYPAGAHGHLVENGHEVVRNGKVVGRAAPHPFVRPAMDETKADQLTAATEAARKHLQ